MSIRQPQWELSDALVKVWISSVSMIKNKTVYNLSVKSLATGQVWQIQRRYSEFLSLLEGLRSHFSHSTRKCPGCHSLENSINCFEFPKKHVFSSRSQVVIRYRVIALRKFIQMISSSVLSTKPKCPTCGPVPLELVKAFLLNNPQLSNDSNMDSIRDSISVETIQKAQRESSRMNIRYSKRASNTSAVPLMEFSEPSTVTTCESDRSSPCVSEDFDLPSPSKKTKISSSKDLIHNVILQQVVNDAGLDMNFTRPTTIPASVDVNNLWEPWELVGPKQN